jgi:transposase
MIQINKKLDTERKKEKRRIESEIKEEKDEEIKAIKENILAATKGSKYPLLKNEKDLNKEQLSKLLELKIVSPQPKIMHEIKEKFRKIFEKKQTWGEGLLSLGSWLSKAQKYFSNSSSTIVRWLDEIPIYFNVRSFTSCFTSTI